MNSLLSLLALLGAVCMAHAQLYFPPNGSNEWETIDPASLGWCQDNIDALYTFLEDQNTKGFIVLKDGKIVLEQYFNGQTQEDSWYWASAGKTLTAGLIGIAQEENLLDITDKTSDYLGQGWTNAPLAKEDLITIWHQLSMTSGLDDGVTDPHCTDPNCLEYLADAGTRWAYHNGPYTLLTDVLENASGQTLNQYANQKILSPTGMSGLYLPQGYNRVFFSTARSMARYGLLILNQGTWDTTPVIADTNYLNEMINTSQNLNEAYGYLWWLNGKDSFMIPQSQIVFDGTFMPNAPEDLVAGLGADGQFLNVIPSQNLVLVRMGEAPNNTPVPFTLNDDIWGYMNALDCGLAMEDIEVTNTAVRLYPNPAQTELTITSSEAIQKIEVFTVTGQKVLTTTLPTLDVSSLSEGMYVVTVVHTNGQVIHKKLLVE